MSSIYVNVGPAIRDIKKAFSQLSEPEVRKSIARAINSTLGVTRTRINKEIRQNYNISASMINNRMFIVRSNYSTLTGSIRLSRSTIPMKEFNPTEVRGNVLTQRIGGRKGALASRKTARSLPQGLSVEIEKGERKTIQSAYFAISGAGNDRVRARGKYDGGFMFNPEEKSRAIKSVSIHAIVMGGKINQAVIPYAKEQFNIIMLREFNKRLVEAANK